MDAIKKLFNFENIGRKIKTLTKWTCWISILLIWIATPVLIFLNIFTPEANVGYGLLFTIAAILFALIASVSVWIGSWAAYAFGEFVEDIHAIRNKEGTTKELMAKRDAKEKAKRAAEDKAKREAARQAQQEAAELARRKAVEQVRCEVDTNRAQTEQLSKSEIENAASAFLNRRVSISEIACTLIYVVPKSTGIPKEMHLAMSVGDQEFSSLDLFFDDNRHAYHFKGRYLALDGAWRSEEEIFDFDVRSFKRFDIEVDEND